MARIVVAAATDRFLKSIRSDTLPHAPNISNLL